MNSVKERIMGAIAIMSNEDAQRIWDEIKTNYIAKQKTFDDLDVVEPLPDEIEAFSAYQKGDPAYQAEISHEDLKKELGL